MGACGIVAWSHQERCVHSCLATESAAEANEGTVKAREAPLAGFFTVL